MTPPVALSAARLVKPRAETTEAAAAATARNVKCILLYALAAALKLKFLFSPAKTGLYTAAIATGRQQETTKYRKTKRAVTLPFCFGFF
jgi:predicted polyphosphate/ATP-dependent NAD kinase